MTISRMQQPRQMYQEGGIMPRLNQLGSGVSSAEQMLQGINQRLESAESSLGSGGVGQDITGNNPMEIAQPTFGVVPGIAGYESRRETGMGQPKQLASIVDDNRFKDPVTGGGQPFFMGNQFLRGGDLIEPQTPVAMQSPLSSAMRNMAAGGGMMGRQMYGLGSLVKSVTKGVKGVVSGIKDLVKADLGKAALLIGGGMYAGGLGPFKAGSKLFGGALASIPGAGFASGLPGLISGGIESLRLKPGPDGPTFGQFAKVFGIGALGGAALQALEASGAEEEDITDIDALRSYLRQGYRQLNPEASNDDIDAFVEQNTVEYRANGGRIGYAEGMNDPKTLPKGLTMDTTTKNPIPEDALPKEIEFISKVMLGPGRSGIGEPEDGTMKGYQFFKDQYLPKKIKQLSDNFGYSEDEIYKMINTRIREYLGSPGKPLMAEGGRMKYAMGDSAEQNAMQASGIMGLPLNQNPAGITELDLRETGGFIPPVGVKEKADDIPAMLSNNEFVFTADAVRGMGGGDVEKGAQKLYDQMKMLEEGGRVA